MKGLATPLRRAWLGLQLGVQRHTAWWLVPLALIAVAMLSALLALRGQEQRVAELRVAAEAAAKARRAVAAPESPPAPARLEPQIERLLPDDAQATRMLERLFDLARQHDLHLRRGEYKAGQLRPISVDSVQVTLPLQGDYAKLRGWIADVLAQVPQASVERLALRRDALGQNRLDADVVVTLWRRTPQQRAAQARTTPPAQLAMERRP